MCGLSPPERLTLRGRLTRSLHEPGEDAERVLPGNLPGEPGEIVRSFFVRRIGDGAHDAKRHGEAIVLSVNDSRHVLRQS